MNPALETYRERIRLHLEKAPMRELPTPERQIAYLLANGKEADTAALAEMLAKQEAVIDLLINNHIMNIHRMPHEGHGYGSYFECRHELCIALAALRSDGEGSEG